LSGESKVSVTDEWQIM
jgi:type III secretory pathway component EscR